MTTALLFEERGGAPTPTQRPPIDPLALVVIEEAIRRVTAAPPGHGALRDALRDVLAESGARIHIESEP